ncbi:tautomerase family protein [Bradyrhizobium campsiandrae]|uniref:tautomerase family protein n=1 Tax=Bradyrhizobium campsiandrae TaxID=1729892 RepID=UPI0027B90E1C|nr:tautomerase family protein [Bradyrhizobium campsiandrae]
MMRSNKTPEWVMSRRVERGPNVYGLPFRLSPRSVAPRNYPTLPGRTTGLVDKKGVDQYTARAKGEGRRSVAVIQCDIRRGRTPDQKRIMGEKLTRAVHEITGLDIDNILVIFREQPGQDLLEGGVVLPDYQAGPNGEDLAGAAEFEARARKRKQS